MRCFIALELPKEIKKQLSEVQEKISDFNLVRGKFTEFDNLHLTLKFLGEVEEEKIEEIKNKLKEINISKFSASFGEVGVFNENFVKIIWVKLKGADELQKEIDEKLKGLFEPEERFMSHITIMRPKYVKDRKKLIEELKKIKLDGNEFLVEKFVLMKSELTPSGPTYTLLDRYVLSQHNL